MNRLLNALLNLLYPPKCPFCGKVLDQGEDGLCFACQRILPWVGEDEVWTVEFCDGCLSPLWYRDGARDGVHRYKFQNGRAPACSATSWPSASRTGGRSRWT